MSSCIHLSSILALLVASLAAPNAIAQMSPQEDSNSAINEASATQHTFDFTQLTAHDTFTTETGYGFDLGTIPNSSEPKPFYFSVAVPEGNYKVTVTFGDTAASSANSLKAESRQLLLEHLTTLHGELITRSFIVNVRTPQIPPPEKNAPGGTSVVLNDRETGLLRWDGKLTLEIHGAAPAFTQ